jgi:heat shock protein HslJ
LTLILLAFAVAFSASEPDAVAQCALHEATKLTASDAGTFDSFGRSVSLSGDRALVGAYQDSGCAAGADGSYCGSAYVYRYNGSTWVQEQKLTASDAAGFAYFGVSVSLSGNRALVGTRRSAYVYRFEGTAWVEEQKLTASDAVASSYFGFSVSLSGDRALVGAVFDDCSAGLYCGSAYVYRYDGTAWVEEQKLTASDAAAGDRFGYSVSLSGDQALVGADYDNCAAGIRCGSAYVYRYDGTAWVEEQKLAASDAAEDDTFGSSVSLSGNRAIVGAELDDCAAGSNCGSAYVYRYDGTAWVEEQKLTASDAAQYSSLGRSVSLSGDRALVGAYQDDCAVGITCGSAYVHRYDGTAWVQEHKLTASDARAGDRLGFSVCLSGDRALVGAYLDACATGIYCGSAYVFTVESADFAADCNANRVSDECDIALCGGESACGDCNGSGIPDGCEIADCAGDLGCADCNENTVPDGCDPDCNANGIADECDIDVISADCNENNVPDECDLDEGVSVDADANGVPDECETGACCDGGHGVCLDGIAGASCTGSRQTWSVNIPCSGLSPPCTATGGACCDHDVFGSCTDGVTQGDCSCAACDWTEDASCEDLECPHEFIPTVNGWGLAVLALLLLTGAKVRFGRVLA